MVLGYSTNGLTELIVLQSEHADVSADLPTEKSELEANVQRDLDVAVATTAESSSTMTPNLISKSSQSAPEIPESYRETIGPAVQHISFGERYRKFEAEPVDDSWAQAMEIGISDFVAIHGPESGEVFEFFQCRSSSCVLAGYKRPGQVTHDASVVGELSRQPWWQGSQKSSATYLDRDGRMSFVVLIPRFDE